MGINGHDDAAETVTGKGAHVRFGPKGAVGANHGVDAGLGAVTNHGAQVFVREWFATDEQEVADVIADGDVNDIAGFLKGDAAALPGIETVHREAAEIALRIANVGDGELEVTGAAVIEDFAEEFEGAFLGLADGLGKVGRRGRRAGLSPLRIEGGMAAVLM